MRDLLSHKPNGVFDGAEEASHAVVGIDKDPDNELAIACNINGPSCRGQIAERGP